MTAAGVRNDPQRSLLSPTLLRSAVAAVVEGTFVEGATRPTSQKEVGAEEWGSGAQQAEDPAAATAAAAARAQEMRYLLKALTRLAAVELEAAVAAVAAAAGKEEEKGSLLVCGGRRWRCWRRLRWLQRSRWAPGPVQRRSMEAGPGG